MNFKDILWPLVIALSITWLFQTIFFWKGGENPATSDRSFIAPTTTEINEPLDFEVDFSDQKPQEKEIITTVNTKNSSYEFSNYGAVINRMGYKRILAGKETLIETVRPQKEQDKGAFLLAIKGLGTVPFGATPYYYKLADKKIEGGVTALIYKAESDKAIVTKEYIIYDDSYRLDMKITIEPKIKEGVRARIFFPAPIMSEFLDTDAVTAVVANEKGAIEKKQLKDIKLFGKESPSIFGLEDRYFANLLIKDPNGFAKRAYYNVQARATADILNAQGILQSAAVLQPTTWTLTFYCGPKEMTSLEKVDSRLEGILDYGWFSFFSRWLLYLLNLFYDLFKNYGVAIIALIILLRILMLPLTAKGEQSRKKQLEAQKKLQYIEQKYKHDPEMLMKEKAEFARKHGLPGMLGCLPLLLQIPIFIGLQRVLSNAIELYKAPFLWIPDLSAPDPLYILPALVGIGVMLQTMQTAGDPRQSVANIIIALIVAAVTINISAGLALFISASTLIAVGQTYLQKLIKA